MTPKVEQMKTGTCGCGRSPTGNCIGWHGLSEEAFQARLAEFKAQQEAATSSVKEQGVAEGLNEPPVSYREMINSVQKQYTKWYSELVNHYAQLGNSSDEFKKKIVAAYNAYKNGQSVAHIPIVGPVKDSQQGG